MDADFEIRVRSIARDEIASLAGKAMRRLQDESFSRSFTRNEATDAAKQVAGHFWAEILAEYGGGESGEVWVMPKDAIDLPKEAAPEPDSAK